MDLLQQRLPAKNEDDEEQDEKPDEEYKGEPHALRRRFPFALSQTHVILTRKLNFWQIFFLRILVETEMKIEGNTALEVLAEWRYGCGI